MEMSVLHITNGYTTSALYSELFSHLAKLGIEEYVLAPTFYLLDTHPQDYYLHQYLRCNCPLSRLLYSRKIRKLTNEALKIVDINQISLIHAHTLFSDGGIALELMAKHSLPYIVAIRNTDINVFFKYFFYLRNRGIKILDGAKRIILISPVYRDRLLEYLDKSIQDSILNKFEVIPNGINPLWIENSHKIPNKLLKNIIRAIYVGDFDKNKNLESTIAAVEILRNSNINIELYLVGLRRNIETNYQQRILKLAIQKKNWCHVYERTGREKIINYFRNSDIFIMPSHTETFGLVYVEALSQGLPIIYTKGEGFDGFFPDGHVGYAVDSHSVRDIADKVRLIIDNYRQLIQNIANIDLSQFSWDNIAKRYMSIYREVLKE